MVCKGLYNEEQMDQVCGGGRGGCDGSRGGAAIKRPPPRAPPISLTGPRPPFVPPHFGRFV